MPLIEMLGELVVGALEGSAILIFLGGAVVGAVAVTMMHNYRTRGIVTRPFYVLRLANGHLVQLEQEYERQPQALPGVEGA